VPDLFAGTFVWAAARGGVQTKHNAAVATSQKLQDPAKEGFSYLLPV
jgi:hypothetical protein